MPNKLITLTDAAALIPDGACLSFGGFTTQRHPMAFVYELIRLRRRNLYLIGHSPGGDWDILIGAGCVKRVELAYEADEAFNTVGPRWRRAVERGQIEWEDYSNFAMVSRFAAGAMGIPFMPIRSLLGSDVLHREALTPEQRAADPRTPVEKGARHGIALQPRRTGRAGPRGPHRVRRASRPEGQPRGHGAHRGPDLRRCAAGPLRRCRDRHRRGDRGRRGPAPRAGAQPHPLLRGQPRLPCALGRHPYAVYNCYDYDPRQLKLYHESAEDDAPIPNTWIASSTACRIMPTTWRPSAARRGWTACGPTRPSATAPT